MKNFPLINPIPKRFVSINSTFMFAIYLVVFFCTELKAIPEDWPSPDGISNVNPEYSEILQLNCMGSIQISLDSIGNGIVTPSMCLVGSYPSFSNFKVVINQTGSNLVSCRDIGKTLTATVTDITNGMMCWTAVKVEDKLKPVILCRADTVSCANDPFTLDYTPYVVITDNCDTNVSAFYDLSLSLFDCTNSRYSSVVHLKWTAIDDYGNTNTCLQDIYFKKSSVDSIVFPPNDTVYCPNPDFSHTGVPTLYGDTVSHLCNLLSTHVDDSIIVCGGMLKLRRLWTVIDWCTMLMRSSTQEILVSDTTRPDISCPRDTILFSAYNSCKVNYTIPNVYATDACSPSFLLIYVVRVDSSFLLRPGQIVALDTGKHTLNYIAIDPCGNSDTCTSLVWVKDKITPSLVCPPALVVSLDPAGHVILTAEQVAARGLISDNCCIDTILVRRMNFSCGRPQDTFFRDRIQFCCEDIRDTIMIVLKATDCSGNMNFCMIEVYVQDKNPIAAPVCPANITVSCARDYFDTDVTGNYSAITACLDFIQGTYIDSLGVDSCKNGIIKRTFYLQYPDGSIDSTCKQRITIFNSYIFNPLHIIWTRDTSIPECIGYQPDDLRSIPSNPRDTCGSVYFTFIDRPVRFTLDSCEIVDRIWSAYSACSHQTVKDTQVIIRISLKRSKLTGPRDTTVANGSDSCARFVKLLSATLTGCSRFTSITNSFNGGGANASGVYPLGTTKVIFTAKDSCGLIRDTTTIIVRDQESPRATCDIIFVDMQMNDSLQFTARSLLVSYSDNCTISNNLKIAFSSSNFNDSVRIITCADLSSIPDTFDFSIFVKDSSGNIGSCIARVHVFDPNFYCTTAIRIGDVNGLIRINDHTPMEGVEVALNGWNKTILSDLNGEYLFNDIITNKLYSISPSYNKNWLEGITTLDIVKIQRHILGIESFTHPFEWVAADVDKNGRISAADITWLRRLIIGKVASVPGNESWRFIKKNFKFLKTEYPLESQIEENVQLNGNWQNAKIDFDAIKVGDVSSINNIRSLEDRLRKAEIIIEEKEFLKGEIFSVDLKLQKESDIQGMQLSFELDNSSVELFQITEYLNNENGRPLVQDEYTNSEGIINISLLIDQASVHVEPQGKLLKFLFRATKNNKVSAILKPSFAIRNEIYLNLDVPLTALFTYKQIETLIPELSNWNVDPNPFRERVYLNFVSNVDEEAYFTLFDLTGKVIINRNQRILKGNNTVQIDGTTSMNPGSYIYHFKLGDKTYYGKVVKAE
ncbi:MAG: T9SS type A sorting domain-containing protein [Saprospiraceae bacterium]